MSAEENKFTLIDSIDSKPPKPERTGPTFAQKSAKAVGAGAKAVGKGVAATVSSGLFWLLTIGGGIVWGGVKINQWDNREQEAFEQGIEKRLESEGFKVLATDRYGSEENNTRPSKRLNFPKDFERATIITVERGKHIYDVGAVRQERSRSGYKEDFIIGYKDITLKKVPAFSNQAKPAKKPVVKKKPVTQKR